MLKSADNQLNDLRTFSLASGSHLPAKLSTTAVIIQVGDWLCCSIVITNRHKGEDTWYMIIWYWYYEPPLSLTIQLIMDVAQVKHRNISVDVNKRNKWDRVYPCGGSGEILIQLLSSPQNTNFITITFTRSLETEASCNLTNVPTGPDSSCSDGML